MRKEFGLDERIDFRVIVDSESRPLRPMIRDEVYRIGREALLNAFVHAQAKSIEVEVEYASRHLRVLVRDDGRGIDPEVLHSGREGHWGLPACGNGPKALARASDCAAAWEQALK